VRAKKRRLKFGSVPLAVSSCLCFFAAAFLFLAAGNPALADEQKGRVVMVIIDRLSLEDLNNPVLGTFPRLVRKGGIGLLNTGTAGIRNPENTYATVGAGAQALATKAGAFAYESVEQFSVDTKVYEEFKRRTGYTAKPGNVVVLEIARLSRKNDGLLHPVVPGILGEQLQAAGFKVACLGNADWRDRPGRQVAAIAMNRAGIVERGYVGRELLMRDPSFPGGFRTNYEVLWRKWRTLKDADFVVIDLGDTSRLDQAREELTDAVFQQRWEETLIRAERFLGGLAADLDLRHDCLLIVSPTPSSAALARGDWFAPVVMVGDGIAPGSVLTSPSTRRPGIVMNTDLAPTVLRYFGLAVPATMSGRPVASVQVHEPVQFLEELWQQACFIHNFRAPVIKTYLGYALILLVVAVLFILLREKRWAQKLQLYPLLFSLMAFPVACLVTPLFKTYSLAPYLGEIVAVTALFTLISQHFEHRKPLAGFVFLSLTTAGLILADVFTGATLLRESILSYDAMGGARFYGIGNEYMGVLTSATIFASACALSVWPRRLTLVLTALLGLLVTVTLGMPGLGANFGGLLTAVVAFPVTFLAFAGVGFSWRAVAVGGAVFVLLPVMFAVYDLLWGRGGQSHIGRNLFLVFQEPSVALEILKRKMAMNMKLFRYTIWSRVLAAGIGGLLLLSVRPVAVMRVFRSQYPYLFTGFIGVVVTAVAAFLFNDSGTVAATTATVFGIPPLLYLLLKEI
jgi:hypothetical protein